MKYCESIFRTSRRKTREVMVGKVGVGGNHPIRIQSMTTSNTRDVEATIEQIIRLADSGCEIARMTVQGMKEAEACEEIKNGLVKKGYDIPLVADIHFFPPAAMRVADSVDKVRINPGNYVDKRASFKEIEYDEASYAKEIEKIEEKFTPLVEKCKRLNRAMRIGTNHGSLSDRIMNRYGDTPQGMVESALEFARVCRTNDYHDFMFSMKSSNPQVMVQAYRLLVAEMVQLGWEYPLHLGVTEAGEGEDGRIKSAMGIGSLLLDGIGDTIRVSLTEDPWQEIDPCKRLICFAEECLGKGVEPFQETHRNIESITRRQVSLPKQVPMHWDGTVILTIKADDFTQPALYEKLGCEIKEGSPKSTPSTVDAVSFEGSSQDVSLKEAGIESLHPIPLREAAEDSSVGVVKISNEPSQDWQMIEKINPAMIILSPTDNRLHYCRQFFEWLQKRKLRIPVILNFYYDCPKEDLVIQAAAEMGSLLCDRQGEGVWIEGPYDLAFLRKLSFNILQSARMRLIKTDFISCPGCGRTLFDLQEVSKRIRSRTDHLPGVKIAIMGCIVNGPGEMADADFGYVGSRPGKIDLYVGKECVERNIDFSDADDRLIELIKAHGRWVDA
ncbi:MAG: 4-hydroxy-3-methylbut-2-en-1-yl diphosphate synthase (ferredoxin) [Chlamydiae bacterium]|nr:4-hydroxy-3-methylbut-2-en-1-yl diphosphate synthase (ferredoxin) [Chlamydiota bacterium]